MSLIIRPAVPGEAGLVLAFILKLAEYEKLAHEVVATEALVKEALFGADPKVFCDIAEWEGEHAGFALWFYSFSTFRGRHGIWLEDLFVEPAFRGRSIGKALLRHLAARCREEGLTRLEWWVLDWNAPSIDFYRGLGAEPMQEWTRFRLSGEALASLAAAHSR
ncbi:MAG: N-acetyltransferase family protein [Parvibaculaceae bacterium]